MCHSWWYVNQAISSRTRFSLPVGTRKNFSEALEPQPEFEAPCNQRSRDFVKYSSDHWAPYTLPTPEGNCSLRLQFPKGFSLVHPEVTCLLSKKILYLCFLHTCLFMSIRLYRLWQIFPSILNGMGSKFMNKFYQGSDSTRGDKNRVFDLVWSNYLPMFISTHL